MSGFEVSPDPDRKPTIGEAIDARVTNLERRVALLESLLLAGPEGRQP